MKTYIVMHLDWDKPSQLDRLAITMDAEKDKVYDAICAGHYDLAAVVEAEDLDAVYRLTNHIDRSWTENHGVTAVKERNRSTSVGDIIIECGAVSRVFGDRVVPCEETSKRYVVAGFGFSALPFSSRIGIRRS